MIETLALPRLLCRDTMPPGPAAVWAGVKQIVQTLETRLSKPSAGD